MSTHVCVTAITLLSGGGWHAAEASVVDFEDLKLAPESFYNGSDFAGGFVSNGAFFNNSFVDFGGGFTAWSGWSYSNITDNVTPGFDNQYSAVTGGGAAGSANYGVAFTSEPGASYIELPADTSPVSMLVTNTTWAHDAVLNGDAFANAFGGPTGDDPDFFLLTIEGLDARGDSLDAVEFYLADYRFENNELDYVIDDWTAIDLTSLAGATTLSFGLDSTDVGEFGINTPLYFAADNLIVIPEPGSLMLLACGMLFIVRRRGQVWHRLIAVGGSRRLKNAAQRRSPQRRRGRGALLLSSLCSRRLGGAIWTVWHRLIAGGTPRGQRFAAACTAVLVFVSCFETLANPSPFATTVIDYAPSPGQWINSDLFNDPMLALGSPEGAGTTAPANSSVVTLGGFGGSITLAFDHTVMDESANPFAMDAIVFSNAFWVGGNPNAHWAECAYLEISRDDNGNGLADDAWYLIPGSHINDLAGQWESQTWDDDIGDETFPPANPLWLGPDHAGTWTTWAFRLPPDVFEVNPVVNPNGIGAQTEGIFGYAEFSPTLLLGDMDGDNVVDDFEISPNEFYTYPDDPLTVGISPGAGGGDAFDIAWAIDAATGEPANLDGFDFLRIVNGANFVAGIFGELSPEIDAVADVAEGLMGDGDYDGDVDAGDHALLVDCFGGPDSDIAVVTCRVFDFDDDGDVDLFDVAEWSAAVTGSLP